MAKKICKVCEQSKDDSEFYAKETRCKPCVLARQKELKEAKAGGTAAPLKRSRKSGKPAAPPQAVPAALTMPAGLGLSASLGDDNDIVVSQTSGAGTATIWMSRYEAQQLAVFIAALPDPVGA